MGSDDHHETDNMGKTVGIAVGCAGAYIILVVGLMIYCKGRRARQVKNKLSKFIEILLFLVLRGILGRTSVAQSSEQAPFTSEIMGSILATDSCERSLSLLCRKSFVFSGRSGFLPQGKLTGWVRINI